jgi:Tol biopolymer transport system component
MNLCARTIIAVALCSVLASCDNTTTAFWTGTAGSLGLPALVFAEAPGNGGFDNVAMNGAGTIAVFIASSDPLGTNAVGEDQLFSIVFGDPAPVQLTSGAGGGFRSTDDFDIDASGAVVVFVSDQDITGDNPTNTLNLFAAATDGSGALQVTSLTSGGVADPGISADGATIIFTSSNDLTGGNPSNDTQIFSIAVDGSNLTQLTTGTTATESVEISDDGSKLVWVDTSDPFGTNADGSREIFAMNLDGTNHMQLTMSSGDSITPRISDDGAYVVFTSSAEYSAGSNVDGALEVYVVNTDGTGLVRITDTAQDSGLRFNGTAPAVDISGSGDWITFMSYADLNGLNTGGTYTVYWANRQGTQVQQLLRLETKPDGVSSLFAEVPRMSDDGSRVLFSALAPYSATAPDNGWKMFMHTRL